MNTLGHGASTKMSRLVVARRGISKLSARSVGESREEDAATTKVKLCSVWRSLCRDDNVFNDVAFLRPYKFKSRRLMTGHLPSSSSSITPSLFHSKLNLPFLQTLPTVAFLFFFGTYSADSPDCLPILLTISVFLFSFFSIFSTFSFRIKLKYQLLSAG